MVKQVMKSRVPNSPPASLPMDDVASDRLKQQARQYALSYAIFRPESAIVVALSIICAGLSALSVPWIPLPWWAWLIFGLVGEGALVLSTLRDPKFYSQALSKVFTEQFDLNQLRSTELRQKINTALEYRQLLAQEIGRSADAQDSKLADTVRGMEDWIAQIYRLSQGLDIYLHDPIVERDMRSVPDDLADLQKQRARNLTASLQADLENAINMKQTQWAALSSLRDTMTRAELQLDNTLTAMGTLYMQAKLMGTKDVSNNRAQRLQADMAEQVRQLQDIATAMDEVYSSNLGARAGS